MLSHRARYGLRALIALAGAEGSQLSASQLAALTNAPRKFLETILLEMANNSLLVSQRGKFGGYQLARPAALITFAEVIRTIDGPLALAPCVSPALGFPKCADCPDLATCALREALAQAHAATATILEAHTIARAAAGGPTQLAAI